jgi:hypothetical protein
MPSIDDFRLAVGVGLMIINADRGARKKAAQIATDASAVDTIKDSR